MNRKVLTIAVMSLLLLSAQACVQYTVQPENVTVANGGTFSAQIGLDRCVGTTIFGNPLNWCMDISDVYGMGFDLNYDSAVLGYQGIDISAGVIHGASVVTGYRNSVTDNGKLVVGISKSGQVAGESAQGSVARITLQAKSAGATTLTFKDPHLVDSTGKVMVGWPFYRATLRTATVTVIP